MRINKLLRTQISNYISGNNVVSHQLLELFETVSDTYDYFEAKLTSSPPESNNSGDPQMLREPGR